MLPVSVLRYRDFRNLFIGQSVSQLGDSLYYVAFMFMVGKITGKASMVGYVGAVEMLPYVLFSGYAGVLADRIDRRKLMLWSDWACTAILLAFGVLVFATGTPPVEAIFVTAGLLSAFRAMFFPAKNASIPKLVPLEKTLEANTLNSMSFNIFFALGLALSASVLSGLYALSTTLFLGLTVMLNAVSFGISALYIRALPPIVPDRKDEEQHPWTEFKEGVRYIVGRRAMTVLMVAGLFMSLMIAPFFVVYVAANEQWFDGMPHTLMIFELSFFIGMIVGSAAVARLKFSRVGIGYAMGLGVTGLGVALMAGTPIAWLFAGLNLLCGLFVPFADIPVMTYLQVKVEDAFRGRVNSAFSMLRTGMMPLGMGVGGWVIESIGLVAMFLTMGLGMVVVALAALSDRAFRTASLEPDAEPANGDSPMTEAVA
jgi:MFS family permease